jgi:hypothetical protein
LEPIVMWEGSMQAGVALTVFLSSLCPSCSFHTHCGFSSVEVALFPLGSLGGALADGPLPLLATTALQF